jgi:hypothetical protein
MIMTTEEKAGQALQIAKKTLEELVDKTKSFQDIKYRDKDQYGFILIVFFKRFFEHYNSLSLLEGKRDALLISRSILEGGVLLRWIADPDDLVEKNKRATNYQDLYLIELQKTFERLEPEQNKDFRQAFQIILQNSYNSSHLIDPKEYNDFTLGDKLKKTSFLKRLTGYDSIADLFSSFDSQIIYAKDYSYISGYFHWNPLRIGMYLDGHNNIGLKQMSNNESLLCFFHCLSVLTLSTKEISLNFDLNMHGEISEMFNECAKKLIEITS